jgi:hypothetical protein
MKIVKTAVDSEVLYLFFCFTELCAKNNCGNKSVRDAGRRKKVASATSFPDVPVETPLLVRGRCRCVGRHNVLWKYPVNSRSRPIKWKPLNFIQSNEAITLEYEICLIHNIWTEWTQESKFQWTKVSRASCASCFSLAVTFYRSRRICVCMENRPRAAVSAAHTFNPVIFLSCLRLVFPTLKAFCLSCFLIVNICFYWLILLHLLTL